MVESLLTRQGQVFDQWDASDSQGWSGLSSAGDAFAYVSATSFTITSPSSYDWSGHFKKGVRVKLTNSTVKYFVVTGNATYATGVTTITGLNGGSDYTLVSGTITDLFISQSNPPDFPTWFNWTPTPTGFSVNPTNVVARFRIVGNKCEFMMRTGTPGTSNATGYTNSLPITAATITNAIWYLASSVFDNGTTVAGMGCSIVFSAGTVINHYKDGTLAGWTAANGKAVNLIGFYEF